MRRGIRVPLVVGLGVLVCLAAAWPTVAEDPPPNGGQPPDGNPPPTTQPSDAGGGNDVSQNVSAQLAKARNSMAMRSIRTLYGRARTAKDPAQRQARLDRTTERIAALLDRHSDDPAMTVELLTLQACAHIEHGAPEAARQAVRRQHARYKTQFGDAEFEVWRSQEAERSRNRREYDLAIMHLSETVDDSESEPTGQRLLLIGDILVQKGYPHGPYDEAIGHYDAMWSRFQASLPGIAQDARLRQAKTCWRSGQTERARAIFAELAQTAGPVVAEEARHLPTIMELALNNTQEQTDE